MLPKQICTNCYKLLNQCLAFKKQIASTDNALRRCINQLKQVEMAIKEEVDDASDNRVTQQYIFDATSALKELNEGYKIEELFEEERFTAGDVIIWEKDANLYTGEDKKSVAGYDSAIVYLSEGKSGPITSPIDVVSPPSKEQRKSRTSVKCKQSDKTSDNLHIQEQIKLRATEKLNNRCRVRSKSFCQETGLEDHMVLHQSQNADVEGQTNASKCTKCNESSAVERDICIHGLLHLEDKKFQCRQCGKDFSKLINLQRHMNLHYKNKPRCPRKPIRKPSNARKLIRPVYRQTFDDPSVLTNHISLHADKKPFVCKICDKTFKLKCHLLIHLRQHTGEKPYKCSDCPKSFRLLSSLADHVRTHTGEKPFKCSYCSRSFIRPSTLADHVRRHMGKKPHICPHCSKSFIRPSTLADHVNTHTGDKPHKCSNCSKSFFRRSTLAEHVRKHTREKSHKCPHCLKPIATSSELIRHIRTHTGEKPYKCPHCSKSFGSSSGLTVHVRMHTGEKPYKCPHCSKSFAFSSALADHVHSHTGEKPFKCSYCSKSFIRPSRLAEHVGTHTGEKPYKSPQSSKSIAASSELITRISTHTDEKP